MGVRGDLVVWRDPQKDVRARFGGITMKDTHLTALGKDFRARAPLQVLVRWSHGYGTLSGGGDRGQSQTKKEEQAHKHLHVLRKSYSSSLSVQPPCVWPLAC